MLEKVILSGEDFVGVGMMLLLRNSLHAVELWKEGMTEEALSDRMSSSMISFLTRWRQEQTD